MGTTRPSRVFVVSFGDNEFIEAVLSLAIARMFGGFPASFYESYHQHRAKSEPSSEYSERQNLYEAFHYLNHTLLFEGTYESAARLRMERALRYVISTAA